MKNINLGLLAVFAITMLFSNSTLYGQIRQLESVPKKGQVQVLEATSDKQKKVTPQNELTPAQKKALQRKRNQVKQIKKAQAAKKRNAANQKANVKKPKGTVQKLNLQKQKGVKMSAADVSKRKRGISKALAISTINKANGRVKAGEAKLAAAKSKLATIMASGNYTDEGINEKKRAIAVYEEYLVRLKKSIEIGNKQVKN